MNSVVNSVLFLSSLLAFSDALLQHPKLFVPAPENIIPAVAGDGAMGVQSTTGGTLLVTYESTVTPASMAPTIGAVASKFASGQIGVASVGVQKTLEHVNVVEMKYTSEAAMLEILSQPGVKAAEPIQRVKKSQAPTISWGWDRVTTRIDSRAVFPGAGDGVDVYVIDTGINPNHPDLAGRVTLAFVASGAGSTAADDEGHGSHVSGTVGGLKYGIATRAQLFAVKVLDAFGSGSNSGVVAGMNFVLSNLAKRPGRKAVVNMSLGGGDSLAIRDAVKKLTDAGIIVVCAAGNENQAACNSSPGNAPSSFTVAASTSSDAIASYSNWGSCVDIIAPGSSIWSVAYTGGFVSFSGTSMAAPHVAGAIAVYWGLNPTKTAAQVQAAMQTLGIRNAITGSLNGSPNILLYVGPEYAPAAATTTTATTTTIRTTTTTPRTSTTIATTTTVPRTTTTTTAVATTTTTTPPECAGQTAGAEACLSDPCMNGAECLDLANGDFFCKCPPGFTGDFCSTPVRGACASNPCRNGGQCLELVGGSAACVCPWGFSGTFCQNRPTACANRPCRNGGVCHERLRGGAVCQCLPGFTGDRCQRVLSCLGNRLRVK